MATKSNSNWGRFQLAGDQVPYRLIFRSYGPEKSGKNHFAFTGPGPIAVQSFDIGLEGVVEKFRQQGKEIRFTEYEFDKNKCTQADAILIRDRFIEDYEIALKMARLIQWDTETELWEIFRYAEFGDASDAPKNYVALNARYRDLIQRAYDANVCLQLIQKVKEKWISVEEIDRHTGHKKMKPHATGEMEPTGFKEAGYIVQANLAHRWEEERGFVVKVVNCRQNMSLAGQEFSSKEHDIDLPTLGQLIFPDSAQEDWE
jgi:hypothetical protein